MDTSHLTCPQCGMDFWSDSPYRYITCPFCNYSIDSKPGLFISHIPIPDISPTQQHILDYQQQIKDFTAKATGITDAMTGIKPPANKKEDKPHKPTLSDISNQLDTIINLLTILSTHHRSP